MPKIKDNNQTIYKTILHHLQFIPRYTKYNHCFEQSAFLI